MADEFNPSSLGAVAVEEAPKRDAFDPAALGAVPVEAQSPGQTHSVAEGILAEVAKPARAIGETAKNLVLGIPGAIVQTAKFSQEPVKTLLEALPGEVAQMQTVRDAKPLSQEWWNAVVPLATQEAMVAGGVRGSAPDIAKPPIQQPTLADTLFPKPTEEVIPSAVQEPSAGTILQRQPEAAGAPGSERVGVEPIKQGEEIAQASKIAEEIKPPPEAATISTTEQPAAEAVQPPVEEAKPLSITSIKNEQVDAERVARGLEPALEPARKAFGKSWDEATAKVDSNPDYPTELVNELRAKPRALTDVEDATLLHRQVDLQNQFDKVGADIIKAQESGDEGAVVEHRTRMSQLSDQLLDLYNVGKSAGTETGRGLAARRLLAAEDFSLAKMLTDKRAINDGKPLTPEQEAEVRDFHGKISGAQKTLDDYLAESALKQSDKEARLEGSKLKGAKTRLRGQEYQLEQKLAFQDTGKATREPVQLDQEGLNLKSNVERLKQDFWQNLSKDRLSKRTPFEKAQDTFTKWRRAFILSSPVTLAKLTSAAAERMVFTPLEEAVGTGLSKVPGISEISKRAPLEGGSSVKAEAAAITEGFTKGMRDAAQTLRTGRSDLDVLYGKKNVLPKEAVDFIGTIHGALKTIPKRAEFARAFQKQVEFGLAKGVDVTDPMIQTRYATQAYKQANKSIFMQDNRVVNGYQSAIARWQQPDKATGRVPVGGKLLATTAKVLLPIVRVPTNIVAETMQYALGTVSAPARIIYAYRRGIEGLKPEEADLIMRELKKGSVGAATMLLGYLNADKVGGYYQPGQKREKDDVKFGGVRVFDHDIPSYLVHNPLLETLQIGATIRRVADSKLRKKDEDTQGLTPGIVAAGLGLADETPFVREMLNVSKLREPGGGGKFAGELAKSITVPAAVQWAAQQMDKEDGDPVKRQATSILEHIQSGIPGLREQLPEKIEKKKRGR